MSGWINDKHKIYPLIVNDTHVKHAVAVRILKIGIRFVLKYKFETFFRFTANSEWQWKFSPIQSAERE